ncbi:MAG: ATP-binding cassette domain-containing protein [Blautia sp.]|nr:ATP-binding cassette domain-containing protein [Blautia sp.]
MKNEVLYLENLTTIQENRSNLHHVSLSLEEGEVVAVIGQDGSGIAILEQILSGIVRPDSGTIYLSGKETVLRSEDDAKSRGIFYICHENAVISELSVSENLNVLKRFMWKDFWIDVKDNERKTMEMFSHYGIHIPLDKDCRHLTVAQSMELYMCRAVLCGARILVCRELGEEFSTSELLELDHFITILKQEGISLLLLNSDLRKTAPVADEVVILRNGYVCYRDSAEKTDFSLIDRHMNILRKDHSVIRREELADPQIFLKDILPCNCPDLRFSCNLYPGQTTGVFWTNGIVGNVVLQIFSGKLKATGVVTEKGTSGVFGDWFQENRHRIVCMGIHFWETNLFHNLTLEEHLLLRFYHSYSMKPLNKKALSGILNDFVQEYQIPREYLKLVPRLIPTTVRNQIALWMALILPPKLLVLDNPLFNADGNMQQSFLSCLEKLKEQKTAVLWSNNNNSSLKIYCEKIYLV